MTVTIEDAEFEKAVKELSAATGEPADVLLKVAVVERLDRLVQHEHKVSAPPRKPSVEELLALIRSFSTGPIDYTLTEDEILGYGPDGFCE